MQNPRWTRRCRADAAVNKPSTIASVLKASPLLQEAAEVDASETSAAFVDLTNCQQRALEHVRELARSRHEHALPGVEERICALGFQSCHLWGALAWIRELAPIIIHVNLDKALDFLEEDTHYRSQFETGTSGGLLNRRTRDFWEHELFNAAYDGCDHFERVKYGVMNVFNDPRGYQRLNNFGDSYLELKDVRLRCTLSPEDSGEVAGGKKLEHRSTPAVERLAVPEYYAHVLQEYSDDEICEMLRAANSRDVRCGDTARVVKPRKYKEVQVHGEVRLDKHVARLVAHERHWLVEKRLESLCQRNGWTLNWADMERSRMEGYSQRTQRAPCRWRVNAQQAKGR